MERSDPGFLGSSPVPSFVSVVSMSPGCRRGTLRLASQAPTTQRFLRNVSSVSLNNEQALLRFGCPFFSHRVPGCRSHPAPHTHGLGDKKRINSAVFAEHESFHNVLVSPRPRVWAAADPRVVPTPLTKETSPRGSIVSLEMNCSTSP